MSAAGFDEILAVDRLTAPVRAFNQNVGPHITDNPLGARVIEHHHIVHHLDSGENPRPLDRWVDWAVLALDQAHPAVTVDADDQHIAPGTSETQELKMAGVQQIEAAIGEHDPLTGTPFGFEYSL